ncbi:MAG TPA: ComF family protein [Verrucomicrobiae bacterium]|nr:ComF family protein [Verrucomicrobiae bacterium]
MIASAIPIQNWLNVGLGFLYPEICQLCGVERATKKEGFVCRRCWQQIRFIRPPFCERCGLPFEGDLTTSFECSNCREMELHFRSARSAVVAKTTVLEIIHRYKYQRQLWFEPFLINLLLREALPVLQNQGWNLIVPVPLYSVRAREREFNQAAQLAKHLSTAAKIPLNLKLIRRISPTATQTLLTREQRAANVRGAFAIQKGAKLNGENIILVDDVFTTGATTNECARILRASGAGDVCVWTAARGL